MAAGENTDDADGAAVFLLAEIADNPAPSRLLTADVMPGVGAAGGELLASCLPDSCVPLLPGTAAAAAPAAAAAAAGGVGG